MRSVFDFDAASKAWMANKMRKGERTVYRCQAKTKHGTQCKNSANPKEAAAKLFCGIHHASSAGSKTT
jgi:hypothetical protein